MLAKWIALALAATPLLGVSVMDRRWPGIEIEFKASLEPSGSGVSELPGAVVMGKGRIYRLIQDAPHHVYFGYDVILEASPDGQTFQVRAEPLSASPDELRNMGLNPDWTKLSLPANPVITGVRIGATVQLDLLENRTLGQKIVDSITVRPRGSRSSPPRDFTVADAELQFKQVQLRVNGSPVPIGSFGTGGAAVWFYVPGHGRFVFSLAPHPELGFVRMGQVNGTRLTLTLGADTFELDSTGVIASTSGAFHIYGRHDDWTPPSGGFTMGSADHPESIR